MGMDNKSLTKTKNTPEQKLYKDDILVKGINKLWRLLLCSIAATVCYAPTLTLAQETQLLDTPILLSKDVAYAAIAAQSKGVSIPELGLGDVSINDDSGIIKPDDNKSAEMVANMRLPQDYFSNFPNEKITAQSLAVRYEYNDFSIPGPNGMDITIKRKYQGGFPRLVGFGKLGWYLETPIIVAQQNLSGTTSSDWTAFGCLGELSVLYIGMDNQSLSPIGYFDSTKTPTGTIAAFNNRSILLCENDIPVIKKADGTKVTFGTSKVTRSPGNSNNWEYFPSKIEDRFGNEISYTYDDENTVYNRKKLTAITRSDGITVNITYKTRSFYEVIDTISVNGRTWNYEYDNFHMLQKAIDPAKRVTTYDHQDVLHYLTDVTTSEGLHINYALTPNPAGSISIIHSVISGPEVRTRKFFYLYPSDNNGDSTIRHVIETEWAREDDKHIVTELVLNRIVPLHDNYTNAQITLTGTIKAKRIYHGYAATGTNSKYKNYNLLYEERNDWRIKLDGTDKCMSRVKTLHVYQRTCGVPVNNQKKVTLYYPGGSDIFTTNYTEYDTYGGSTAYNESNSFSSHARFHSIGLKNNVNLWLHGLPESHSLSATGADDSFTEISAATYYAATHSAALLPHVIKKYGMWQEKVTNYNSNGTKQKSEFNQAILNNSGSATSKNRYVSYSNYKLGIPQTQTKPHRYNGTSTFTESNYVDNNGWVTQEVDGNNHTTFYGHDNAGRLTYVDSPNDPHNWLDQYISWSKTTEGLTKKTIYHCKLNTQKKGCNADTIALTEEIMFNARLNPILRKVTETSSSTSRYQNYRYSDLGSRTFTSFWSNSATETEGETRTYDPMERLKTISSTGGGTATYSYLNGNVVNFENARGYDTRTTYLDYGILRYSQIEKIESPENVTTTLNYNLFGNIEQLTQSGKGKDNQNISLTEYRAYDARQRLCKVKRADVGQTIFGYNHMNELVWKDDQSTGGAPTDCAYTSSTTQRVTYRNDNLGDAWLTVYPNSKNKSDGFTVTQTFDNVGNLKTVNTGTVSQTFDYNSLNNLELETTTVVNKTMILDYGYNSSGHLNSLTYPDGEYVEYDLNAFGEAIAAKRKFDNSVQFTYASHGSYYPNGLVDTFIYGNGVTHKTELNSRKVPGVVRDYKTGKNALHYTYTYDNNLNVSSITDAVSGTYSLSNLRYDGIDRLTATTGGTAIGSSSMQYDGLGNITRYTSKGSSLSYTYDYALNRLTAIEDTSTANNDYLFFTYDNAGNITDTSFNSLIFNRANQVTSANGSNSYIYNGNGLRVKATESGKVSYSFYGVDGKLYYRETEHGGINYIFLGDKLIAKNGFIPENSGKQHYRPYGSSIEGEVDGVGYTGHKFDKSTGLSYMQARYYDPVIGRFYSNDPFGFRDIHSFSRYAYANNNPYKYVDPDGKDAIITLYKGEGGNIFNHIGIGTTTGKNANQTFGKGPNAGEGIGLLGNIPGHVAIDKTTPLKTLTIETTPEQDSAINAFNEAAAAVPDNTEYNLTQCSCVDHVREGLEAGGIELPSKKAGNGQMSRNQNNRAANTNLPNKLFEALEPLGTVIVHKNKEN